MQRNLVKISGLFILMNFLFFLSMNGQNIRTDIEVTIETPTKIWKSDGKITLKLHFGEAPYNIYITEAPTIPASETDILQKKEGVTNESYTFNGLKKGIYYIFIKDASNNTNFKEVNLDNSKNL